MNILIILLVVFCSGYYYATTTSGSSISSILLGFGIIFLLGQELFKQRSTNKKATILISKRNLWLSAYLLITILITSFLHGDFSAIAVKQILITIVAVLIVNKYSWEEFCTAFEKAMVIISVLALFGLFLCQTPIIERLPTIVNYNNQTYVSGIFFSVLKYAYVGMTKRLHGLFWEPGLFASYLSLAMILLKNENKKKYWITQILFAVCLILSRSGAGIAMIPMILIAKIADRSENKLSNLASVLLTVLMVLLFVLAQVGSGFIETWVNSNFTIKATDITNISNYTRTNAILVDLRIAWEHLPFGVGIGGYADEVARYSSIMESSGTSTITTYLAQYGILGVPIVYLWLKGVFHFSGNRGFLSVFATAALMLTILTKEPHGNLLFMNCVFMYIALQTNKQREEESSNSLNVSQEAQQWEVTNQ